MTFVGRGPPAARPPLLPAMGAWRGFDGRARPLREPVPPFRALPFPASSTVSPGRSPRDRPGGSSPPISPTRRVTRPRTASASSPSPAPSAPATRRPRRPQARSSMPLRPCSKSRLVLLSPDSRPTRSGPPRSPPPRWTGCAGTITSTIEESASGTTTPSSTSPTAPGRRRPWRHRPPGPRSRRTSCAGLPTLGGRSSTNGGLSGLAGGMTGGRPSCRRPQARTRSRFSMAGPRFATRVVNASCTLVSSR